MAILMSLINKETFKIICDTRKVESSYIADKIGCKPVSKVDDWLSPTSPSRPTFNQAKKIASCLHVPFAGLYMNPDDIPKKQLPRIVNRRILLDGHSYGESSLNIALFDLLEARDMLISFNQELGDSIEPFDASVNMNTSVEMAALTLRRYFNIDLEVQFKKPSTRQLYLYVRQQVEAKGVFVQCFSGVPLEAARGVAIFDNTMPIVGINENDRPPAKTFSIIHEVVHLFKRQSSLCNEFLNSFSQNAEEIFCNAVAGEFLVPYEALAVKLRSRKLSKNFTIENIQNLADDFSVSKEVITRRLFDNGIISKLEYATYNDEFKRIIEIEKDEQRLARSEGRAKRIPSYPDRDAVDRTSSSICRTLFKGYTEEIFSKQDISRYLGISQKYTDGFLREVSKWNDK